VPAKRRWNAALWTGLLIVLSAPFAYLLVFIHFPITRDVPWATLLMSGAGLALMTRGLRRAWREPQLHRGRILGTAAIALAVAMVAFFGYEMLYLARQLPPAKGAPQVGERAPDFTLPDTDGQPVRLSALLDSGAGGPGRASGVLLVFYRGYW